MPASSFRPRLESLEDRCVPATLVPGFTETPFAGGLAQPTSMAFAPDGRLFVTQKGGGVRVVQNGQLLATPFLTVGVSTDSERGLNGLAFDPDFATNRLVYVYYTTNEATPVNRLSRFTASASNPNVVAADSEVVLLDDIASTNGNHNGGALHFGNDGMLYVGVGEAGVMSNSQLLANLSGKVLRINPDNPGNVIPPDNPFVGTQGARGEIWALGFRNPFTLGVEPQSGRIFVNDVGGSAFEEIDELFRGGNYGWPNAEGPSGNPNFVDPLHAYARGAGAAIAGGAFYRASQFPAVYNGSYFFADFVQGFIRYLPAGSNLAQPFATNVASPVDLDIGPDGRLYVLSIGSGSVSAIAAVPLTAGPRIVVTPVASSGEVRLFDAATGALLTSFFPYGGYQGGIRVAMADVNRDGRPDIITGTAAGAGPHVKVFDGTTLAEIRSFFAYAPQFTGGIQVAGGDINGDGFADILTGVDGGAGPHVKAFDGATGAEIRSFFAFAPVFSGGVRVAAGDVNNDGRADIVVAAGPGGNGHVRVFDGPSLAELASFLAHPGVFLAQSVHVAAADVDGDGFTEVVTAIAGAGPSHVQAFSIPTLTRKASFYAFVGFGGGVRVAATDANGDGRDDLIVAVASAAGPHVKVFDALSASTMQSFFAFAPNLVGGVVIGGA